MDKSLVRLQTWLIFLFLFTLANLAKAYIAYACMYHPAENTRRSRQARAKRRAICEIAFGPLLFPSASDLKVRAANSVSREYS